MYLPLSPTHAHTDHLPESLIIGGKAPKSRRYFVTVDLSLSIGGFTGKVMEPTQNFENLRDFLYFVSKNV